MKAKEIAAGLVIVCAVTAVSVYVFNMAVHRFTLPPINKNEVALVTPLQPLSEKLKSANSPVPNGFEIIDSGTDIVRKGDLVLNHDSGNWIPAEPQEFGLKVEGKIHVARAAHEATQ
jgi:hypothetical protein